MKKILIILNCFLFLVSIGGCSCYKKEMPLGVWWWDDTLDDTYLDFARDNNVTEIYYCSDDFNSKTANFIEKANAFNMKVYWLAGEYQWLDNSNKLYDKISLYKKYQNEYSNQKFDGIHLDIEPHQNPDFSSNRQNLILSLIQLANRLNVDFPDVTFDYDIPFWFNDLIDFENSKKPAYAHMIDIANRVFLMSYRDNYQDIYSISKDEIEYANENNKKLFLGVETKSDEGDNVSFQEEGKKIMEEEIANVRGLIPSDFGVDIHHIKTWYNLKQ